MNWLVSSFRLNRPYKQWHVDDQDSNAYKLSNSSPRLSLVEKLLAVHERKICAKPVQIQLKSKYLKALLQNHTIELKTYSFCS